MDIHALRHTFGTHLSKAGVSPLLAMAAIRHSSLDLTMSVYVDPVLLDVGAAVDALPTFSADRPAERAASKA
jgi:integrase